jgi:hypothetical protein
MPNHVLTEVVFRGVGPLKQIDILDKVSSRESSIDFAVLLPPPLNIWCGNVGSEHRKAFPGTALDWNRANWGTKWNAYGIDQGGKYASIGRTNDTLTLRFQTAWSPPMGWLVALFNAFRLSFDYTYLDEGASRAMAGSFQIAVDELNGDQWCEKEGDDETHRRMHKLLWGVEEFGRDEE